MTVSTEISSNEYVGNGVTTDFDYKFRIFKASNLNVTMSDADGDNVVTLRLGTDYTVTGVNKSAGGKVILTKPLAEKHQISIARIIPIVQETSFRNQGKFLAETHEDAFDYLTMLMQRVWGSLSLFLKRPSILANWFDAKSYRISNLGKPKKDSDAVDLGTMKDAISSQSKRSLRVDDMDIVALPKANDRAGNVLTFDKDGKPIVVAPASGSAIDVLHQLGMADGQSLIGSCLSIDELKGITPKFIYQQQSVLGFYVDTPYKAGGMFFSADSSSFEVDNWVVFPSADPNYVWVRQGVEKERSILNFGAREGQDITEFLALAATKGLTVIQDNPFDVKTTGGIPLGKGIKIKGDDESEGFIVLDSANFDEIFLPNKSEHCYFKAEKARFKAVTCKSNTPYVCGVTMEDPVTSLIEYKLQNCVLVDIGETSDMLYGYNVDVVKTDNKIKMSKGMIDKIIATGRSYLRGITSTNNADPTKIMNANSPRFGRSSITGNDIEVYMPSLHNQDIAKFSGMFNNQKIYGNHFHNTNLKSGAECDLYAGVTSSVIFGNTFRNVSLKCMSLSNSDTNEYLSTFGSVIAVNTLLFDDGAVNNYGVYFKGDISSFVANTIRNNQTTAKDQFIGVWSESNRGNGGYLNSQSPVGNVISNNVVDIQCGDYNGQYWRAFESPSTLSASIISSNVFAGGGLREYEGGINSMTGNSFINVSMDVGCELRTYNGTNSRVSLIDGLPLDARLITPAVGNVSESDMRKVAGVVTPWFDNDKGVWRLYVECKSVKSSDWQYFDVCANSSNGTISQTAGRKMETPSNKDELNTRFILSVSNGNLTILSMGGTIDPVIVKYKWVSVHR
ncbi:hypothetical protein QS795_009240 [Providencia zhijiangensis]|uniref:Right handed beta helix region n=1 Tax=Providencia zhijiangensis TaxID=3053982 RepID=A0ABZ0MX47_9GAMM|nr:hypothetical protein [Providencia sp. D4759]WPA90682.1 hypothetical protein QS795_009240 [Providencia sp. D4759]